METQSINVITAKIPMFNLKQKLALVGSLVLQFLWYNTTSNALFLRL